MSIFLYGTLALAFADVVFIILAAIAIFKTSRIAYSAENSRFLTEKKR